MGDLKRSGWYSHCRNARHLWHVLSWSGSATSSPSILTITPSLTWNLSGHRPPQSKVVLLLMILVCFIFLPEIFIISHLRWASLLGQDRGYIEIGSRYPERVCWCGFYHTLFVGSIQGYGVYLGRCPVAMGLMGGVRCCRSGSSHRGRSWLLCHPDMLSDTPPRILLSTITAHSLSFSLTNRGGVQ